MKEVLRGIIIYAFLFAVCSLLRVLICLKKSCCLSNKNILKAYTRKDLFKNLLKASLF